MHPPSDPEQALRAELALLRRRLQELESLEADRLPVAAARSDAESRYHLLFDHSPYGIVIIDPVSGRLIEFNETAHRQLGYSREEFAGMSISDFEVVETPEELRATIAAVIRTGRKDFETRHRTKGGDVIAVQVTAQSTEFMGKRVYHCVWHDITRRKQAEEELRESERKYRELVDSLPISLFETDLEGQVTSANPATSETFAYSQADFEKGLNGLQMIAPEDQGRLAGHIQELLAGGEWKGPSEYTGLRKDGSTFPCMIFPSVIIRKGKPAGLRGAVIDVTSQKRAQEELRQAEEKYRGIFENAIEGIFQATPEGRYRSVNPAFAGMFGFASPEEMIRQVADIRELYVNPTERGRLLDALAAHGYVKEFETEVLRRDGSRFWIAINARAVRDAGGALLYYEGTNVEITARKQAEEVLKKSEAELRRLIETLPIAVFVDIQGKIVYANPALVKLFKASSPDEVIGTRLTGFASPELFDFIEKRRRSMAREKPLLSPLELNLRCVDGSVITVVSTPMPMTFQEQPAILVALYDITERKRSEIELEKARKLLQIQGREIEDLQARLSGRGET